MVESAKNANKNKTKGWKQQFQLFDGCHLSIPVGKYVAMKDKNQ